MTQAMKARPAPHRCAPRERSLRRVAAAVAGVVALALAAPVTGYLPAALADGETGGGAAGGGTSNGSGSNDRYSVGYMAHDKPVSVWHGVQEAYSFPQGTGTASTEWFLARVPGGSNWVVVANDEDHPSMDNAPSGIGKTMRQLMTTACNAALSEAATAGGDANKDGAVNRSDARVVYVAWARRGDAPDGDNPKNGIPAVSGKQKFKDALDVWQDAGYPGIDLAGIDPSWKPKPGNASAWGNAIRAEGLTTAQDSNGGYSGYLMVECVAMRNDRPANEPPKPAPRVDKDDTRGTSPAFAAWNAADPAEAHVVPGQALSYSVYVSESAGAPDSGLVVKDYLPAGTTYVSHTSAGGATGTRSGGVITWTGVSLDAKQTLKHVGTVTVRANADLAAGASVTNKVTLSGGTLPVAEPTGNETPNAPATDNPYLDAEESRLAPHDLAVTKDDGKVVLEPGDETTYTITVTNHGLGDEPSVRVVDTLPPHVSFASAQDGGTVSADGVTVTWPAFALKAGASATRKYTVRVDAGVPRPVDLPNLVTVAGVGQEPPDCEDAAERDRCAEDVDTTEPSNLKVVKDVVDADVRDGGTVTWRITVGNEGPARTRDTRVSEILPEQVDPGSLAWGEPSKGTIEDGTWLVGTLDAGETATVEVKGVIKAPGLAVGDVLVNTVTASSPDDPGKGSQGEPPDPDDPDPQPRPECEDNETLEADTDGCDVVAVEPTVSLAVTKDDGQVAAEPGQSLTYTVVGTNTAAVIDPDVVMVDVLPPEVSFTSASDGGSYDAAAHAVTWPATSLAPGQQALRTVTVTVKDGVDGSRFTNYATITGGGPELPDPRQECLPPGCADDTDDVTPPARDVPPDDDVTVINTGVPQDPEPRWWLPGAGVALVAFAGGLTYLAWRRGGGARRQ